MGNFDFFLLACGEKSIFIVHYSYFYNPLFHIYTSAFLPPFDTRSPGFC